MTYFRINKNGWVLVVDKNQTKLITIYKVDLGLGEEFNKQYIAEMTKFVENALQEIENDKTLYSDTISSTKETIEDLRKQNNLLQAQINNNNDTIKLLESEDKILADKISIEEKQLKAKIEKFIGAKVF